MNVVSLTMCENVRNRRVKITPKKKALTNSVLHNARVVPDSADHGAVIIFEENSALCQIFLGYIVEVLHGVLGVMHATRQNHASCDGHA
jgi:hypothetical protein